MVNIILKTQLTVNNYQHGKASEFDFIAGIAIKLTELDKINISLRELLDLTSKTILIDAEYERLDKYILDLLDKGILKETDLKRLLITVQAKRIDARLQLETLRRLNIAVVLVAGNKAYVDQNHTQISVSQLMGDLYSEFSNIQYLGVSGILLHNIEKYLGETISSSNILSLYGEQTRINSHLWVFTFDNHNSAALKGYINRRNKQDDYQSTLDRYTIDVNKIKNIKGITNKAYLFLDLISQQQFFHIINDKAFF